MITKEPIVEIAELKKAYSTKLEYLEQFLHQEKRINNIISKYGYSLGIVPPEYVGNLTDNIERNIKCCEHLYYDGIMNDLFYFFIVKEGSEFNYDYVGAVCEEDTEFGILYQLEEHIDWEDGPELRDVCVVEYDNTNRVGMDMFRMIVGEILSNEC